MSRKKVLPLNRYSVGRQRVGIDSREDGAELRLYIDLTVLLLICCPCLRHKGPSGIFDIVAIVTAPPREYSPVFSTLNENHVEQGWRGRIFHTLTLAQETMLNKKTLTGQYYSRTEQALLNENSDR